MGVKIVKKKIEGVDPPKSPNASASGKLLHKAVGVNQQPNAEVSGAAIGASGDEIILPLINLGTLTEGKAQARVLVLEDDVAKAYLELGGILSAIHQNGWFGDHPSFDKWIEAETAMRRSKAYVLMRIFNVVEEAQVPHAALKTIGWTKMRTIAPVLNKDASYWISQASETSRAELAKAVKKYLSVEGNESALLPGPTHRRTFAFYDEQVATVDAAISKVMEQFDSTVQSQAIEWICLDYIGKVSLKEELLAFGKQNALALIAKLFPDEGDPNLGSLKPGSLH